MLEFKKKKKKNGSGNTALIISNEEMNDIIKTIQDLENSNTLLKGVTKTIKNETKEQKGGFLSMLYIINLDEYADVGTHWIVFFCKTK